MVCFQGFEKYIKALNEVVLEYQRKIDMKINANRRADRAITEINVVVNELQFERDLEKEKMRKDSQKKR